MSKLTLQCELYEEPFPVSDAAYEYIRQYCASGECRSEYRRGSHLFVPLNKMQFLDKIGRGELSAADGFIWDLEDSVPTGQKQLARNALSFIPKKTGRVEYNIRINCGNPSELERDLLAIERIPIDSITLPKGESAAEVLRLMRIIGEDKSYIVTIETLKGLQAIDEIACVLKPRRDALGFGVGDMSTELGIARTSTCENPLFQQILGIIAMAGKRYNLDLFDSVSARFNDPEIARLEAELSCKSFGYTGKKMINPKQLNVINQVFAPPRDMIAAQLYTIESFLANPETNAHVVSGEYKGMPAFKLADRYIKKLLRQGYLGLIE